MIEKNKKMNFLKYKNTLRKIRKIRKLSGRTNFTRSLHNFSGICLVVFLIYWIIFRDSINVSWFLISIIAGISTLAFMIEINKTTNYLLKKWWKTWMGKLLYSLTALILTLLSTLATKQLIHEITGNNPIYYPEFLSLLSIVITIFLIVLLIQIIIGILSILFIIKAYGIMLVDMMFTTLLMNNRNYVPTLVRIISGKKEKYPRIVLGWYSMSMLFGAMSVLFVLSYPGQLLAREAKSVESFLIKSMVFLEYKTGSNCSNLQSKAKIVYLNSSLVSVARWNKAKKNYEFYITECKF